MLLFPFIHKFNDLDAASTTIDAMTRSGWDSWVSLLSLQPAHGGIGSISPDHEVIDGTWNRSEDGPEDAEDDYPSCPASRVGNSRVAIVEKE